MPKTRKSSRNKRKNGVSYSTSRSSGSSKNPKSRTRHQTRKNENLDSSNSETSPFKGFSNPNPQQSPPELVPELVNLEAQPENSKDDLFDSLLDDEHRNHFHGTRKTYKNKKKENRDKGLHEFSDCQNRTNILKWLNDTRNVFDRLTQTQVDVVSDVDTQVTFDMPSVSQKPRKRSSREPKSVRRSPPKTRARSLDIHIKKNEGSGRNERHSLAGDTPGLENYQIEEVMTDEDVAVPAEKDAKIIIDLMEEEYLDNIEREMQTEKKNQSGNGWGRIKDMSKSLNRQPKQLKVVVKGSPKKEVDSLNNNRCYDYDVLESYFIENMEKLMNDEKTGLVSGKNLLQAGKDFVQILRKFVGCEDREKLNEFKFVADELKTIFNSVEDASTQTCVVSVDKNTQVRPSVGDMGVQTHEPVVKHHKFIQTEVVTSSVEIQTVDESDTSRNMVKRQFSAASTTPSDIFVLDDEERREINDAFETEFGVKNEQENQPKSEVFEDDIDFDFNTEDMLKGSKASTGGNGATAESDLVVSGPSTDGNVKGTKRFLPESPLHDPDKYRSKRPCAQFINEELSVAFSEEIVEERGVEVKKSQVVITLSDDNDSEYNHYIDKVLEKTNPPPPQAPAKTRTQEQIEELEEMIANARKTTRNVEDPTDYFKPSSYFPNPDKTSKNIRRNLFDAKNDQTKISPSVFSESMFASERNVTVVANQTLTEDNVDIVMKQVDPSAGKAETCDLDREVENIMKVNILENVVVKNADSKKEEDLSQCSDVDIVESTPQKIRFPSFSSEREESALDVTLPPPIEFQDSEKHHVRKSDDVSQVFSPPRRPLAIINKITSTPVSQRQDSENISLSPISCHGNNCKTLPKTPHEEHKKVRFSPIQQTNKSSNRENRRTLGPYELAQQQFSKFCPLTIIKKPLSQGNSTPKQKSILTYVRPSQDSPKSHKSASFEGLGHRKPCIACSRVSKEQVIAISSLTNKKLASYSTSFTPKVTHLIVATNDKNCLKDHTIKFVSAVASGAWVLNFGWVQQCLAKNALVPEEPFEVLDVSGAPGPQRSRLNRSTKPLFKGYKIHAAAPFASTTQQEVESVVRLLGGKVVPSPEHLLDKHGFVCVIVTEARATQDFELYETWLEALKVVTVDIEWLSRSVGQYNLLSLRPFTLCSDDTIDNLGYPPELTANMTYSFSQQTFSSVPSST